MESTRDTRQQALRVDAVIVRKRDEIRVDETEADVARAREAALGVDARHVDAATADDRLDALVVVLVDDDHAQSLEVLCLDRVEKHGQLVASPRRRDDEVERRKLPRHGP